MSDRPAIPKAVAEELVFECRYLCSACCEPVALEKAHIISWSKSKDHSLPNLIVLCANCHTRSHAENWPESNLRRFKERPCALERDRLPPMSSEQRLMVDFVLAAHPDSMTDKEKLRFAFMTAAYVGVSYTDVRVLAVTPTHSSRVRLELPRAAAEGLIAGYQADDPRLFAFLAEAGGRTGVMRVEAVSPDQPVTASKTDVSEKGLETLIFPA